MCRVRDWFMCKNRVAKMLFPSLAIRVPTASRTSSRDDGEKCVELLTHSCEKFMTRSGAKVVTHTCSFLS